MKTAALVIGGISFIWLAWYNWKAYREDKRGNYLNRKH